MTQTERVFADVAALARAAAEIVAETATRAVAARGRFMFVLAGGSTPRVLYELLAGEYADRVDWARTHIFFGDERCVDPDHKDSNYALANRTLLARVPLPPENVHRIESERGAALAAERYEDVLRRLFPGTPPAALFDLVLLGMGADGHTLSLFPGHDFDKDAGRWVIPATAPDAFAVKDRVTLTLDAVAGASRAMFLVAGADKGAALAAVRQARNDGGDGPPAARVKCRGEVLWLVDVGAAGKA